MILNPVKVEVTSSSNFEPLRRLSEWNNTEAEFPRLLQSDGPRVLKQNRGNGGQGVWKVELAESSATVVRSHWRAASRAFKTALSMNVAPLSGTGS